MNLTPFVGGVGLAGRSHRARAKQSIPYAQDDGALWFGGNAAGSPDCTAGGEGE